MLCGQCLLIGYCRRLRSRKVTEREIEDRLFVAGLKRHARALDVSFDAWAEYLIGLYRDYPGSIVDSSGQPVELDTETLAGASIKYWFREFIGKDPMPVSVSHIRREARSRVIVMASILKAVEPVRASLWGKVIANDHVGTLMPANSNRESWCPNSKLIIE